MYQIVSVCVSRCGPPQLNLSVRETIIVKDTDFKDLDHRVGPHRIASIGNEISGGYKPDITIEDSHGNLKYILECEQKTDRKAFIGDLIKAEKHAEDFNANPSLIIVMKPEDNTTIRQIGDHIKIYVEWLARIKGKMNLSSVVVISDANYVDSFKKNELIGSQAFLRRSYVIAP